jgi:hypothetical protein
MPVGNWADLVDFIFHLPNPMKESWICEKHQDIRALRCQCVSQENGITKAIDGLDDEIIIHLDSPVVRMFDSCAELPKGPLACLN